MEHYIKNLANLHPSFFRDTPHILCEIKKINEGTELPENVMLVTMDVTRLFANTPQDEGARCTEDAINNDAHVKTSPMFLVRLLEII